MYGCIAIVAVMGFLNYRLALKLHHVQKVERFIKKEFEELLQDITDSEKVVNPFAFLQRRFETKIKRIKDEISK